MSTDMVKNIFKDNPLKNFTNATKERYWSIVRSDRFVRFKKTAVTLASFQKDGKHFFLRDKLNSSQSG